MGRNKFMDKASCKLSIMKSFTWQPVDEAPLAKLQVTVILPSSSTIATEDWRPVVSVSKN